MPPNSTAAIKGRRTLRRAAGFAVAALAGACAVGPDYHTPAPPAVSGYTQEKLPAQTTSADTAAGTAQRFVDALDIPGQWWQLFHSDALNRLIEEALATNPNLAAAQAALREAQEAVAAQAGASYPQITASLSPSRNKTATGSLSPASASGSPYYGLYTAQVSVAYVVDVFGANRRQVESLAAQADAERYALEATYLTLTSNLVAAAVQEASLRAQIAATQEMVTIETQVLDLLRRQNTLGQIARADVVQQEAALAQVQQTLPPLHKQLAQQRDLLTALAGRLPSDEIAETFQLSALALPQDLPVSLPAKLVEQRPDVLMADANLHSASAQVGVAIANRLPNLSLTADVGTAANRPDDLLGAGTGFWTLAGSLTQPIFDAGTLRHRQHAAEDAFDEATAQYRATVITAFQNVADCLRALQSDADALRAALAAEQAAQRSVDITRRQLELGQINYLGLLSAEQGLQQSRIALVQAQANRFADTAALFQALGGGWWNRTDVAPLKTARGRDDVPPRH